MHPRRSEAVTRKDPFFPGRGRSGSTRERQQPLRYRQETIFGRAGLAIPRSTLGVWVGTCGVRLQPLVDALKEAILAYRVLHADETPVAMLRPGTGKTHRAYLWAYTSTLVILRL